MAAIKADKHFDTDAYLYESGPYIWDSIPTLTLQKCRWGEVPLPATSILLLLAFAQLCHELDL